MVSAVFSCHLIVGDVGCEHKYEIWFETYWRCPFGGILFMLISEDEWFPWLLISDSVSFSSIFCVVFNDLLQCVVFCIFS